MFCLSFCKALAVFLVFAQLHIAKANLEKVDGCEADQFQCYNGECISVAQKCDLHKDCTDGTDEIFEQCFDMKCPDYQCAYGACYEASLTCDGIDDCWDGTDEFAYHCVYMKDKEIIGNCGSDAQFECQESKKCISSGQLCNGREDCDDKSDEWDALCVGNDCAEDSFRCAYGACIESSKVCDNSKDCRDGSDELPLVCQKYNALAETHSASEEWFKCLNGQLIDFSQKCDQIYNCADRSDEAFETCYNTTCNEEEHFKCGNGGCIRKELSCDGFADCLDRSDENKFVCANETNIEGVLREYRGSCGSDFALDCKDEDRQRCLMWSQVCDGHVDCKHGRDESSDLCGGSYCPPDSFRCRSGTCIEDKKLCDRRYDCYDGSDELAGICQKITEESRKDVPEPAPGPAPEHAPGREPEADVTVRPFEDNYESVWRVDGCPVSHQPGRIISDFFSEFSYSPTVQYIPPKAVVTIICDAGYEIFGTGTSTCKENNEWHNGILDECMRVCNQSIEMRHHSYQPQCRGDFHTLRDCTQKTFPLNTTLHVTCAPGYRTTNNIDAVEYTCNANGDWAADTTRPACEPICGVKSPYYPEVTPWNVSIFQRDFDTTYVFKCLGTILSPYVVITSAECVQDPSLDPLDKHVYFAVVEGAHTRDFEMDGDHGYTVHTLAKVHSVTAYKQYSAVLLTLVKPFKLGPKVRPVCLDISKKAAEDQFSSDGNFEIGQTGMGITVKGYGNKYTLTHFVKDSSTQYDIRGFSKPISDTIAEQRVI